MNALLASAWLQARVVLTRPMNFVTGIITPLMMTGILVLPRAVPPTPEQATGILSGSLLFSFWGASIWSGMGILRRERSMGTFARSLTGVKDARVILLGKIIGGGVFDLSLILLVTVLGALLYGLCPVIAHPSELVLGLLLVVFSGTGFSLLLGSIMVITRHGFQISQLLGSPITLLGGTVLPLSFLPDWLSWTSRLISLSWLQQFIQSTATGSVNWWAFLAAAGLSVLYGLLGLYVFHRVVNRARKEGNLELV